MILLVFTMMYKKLIYNRLMNLVIAGPIFRVIHWWVDIISMTGIFHDKLIFTAINSISSSNQD